MQSILPRPGLARSNKVSANQKLVPIFQIALSALLSSSEGEMTSQDSAWTTPIGSVWRNHTSRRRRDILLDFLDILCHPGALIKHLDISIDALGQRWKLHWLVVAGLCDRLVHMPALEELNLGHWSCRGLSLLADHNQVDGWPLEYLSNLRTLKVNDVSQRFFQSIGTFGLNLKRLHVFASDITDTVTWWVSKCQNLEVVELFEDKEVTPVGYAQLLRANPNLKSLGRCDCFGQVLFMLYDKLSLYRRY